MESSTEPSSLLHTFKSKKKPQIGSDPNDASSTGAPSMDPWSSKTPEKPITAPRRTRNRSTALSLKDIRQAAQKLLKPNPTRVVYIGYELLVEFFSRMANSVRLLKLKGSSTTFTNISTKVECLTDRKFTYNHLAQLKFLLPEAIEMKKMLVFDERTSCMKPDLHITLNANGVEVDGKLKSSSGNVQLWDVFHHRILDFFKSHPEGDDIPEEALPGAFSTSKQEHLTNSSSPVGPQSIDETPINPMQKPPVAVSHLAQSFRKSFSHRASIGAEPEIANCSTNTSKAGDDIPEEALPGAFSTSKQEHLTNSSSPVGPQSIDETPINPMQKPPVAVSHLAQSFRKSFSHRASIGAEPEIANCSTNTSKAGDDIPEEALPGAFSTSKQEHLTNSSSPVGPQSIDETPINPMQKPPVAVSHLAQSFRKSFSHRASIGAEPEIANCSTNTSKAVNKTPSKLLSTRGVCSVTLPPSPLPSTPLKNTKGEDCLSLSSSESTPAKLMASTPAIQPPKRCYMSPDGESTESPIKLARRPPPSRLLTFDTPVKSSKLTADDEILDILNGNLLQSIRDKEQKALEENDPAISQAKWRKKMISSLPKFFDMIYFLFQSMKRSVITKEELMHKVISSHLDIADKREVEEQLWLHKVISSHLDIADKREVEEQLWLLQEIAPEWIHEKLASSGDLLLCVSKVSNAESICTRIAEAK